MKLIRYDDDNNRFYAFIHNGYDSNLLALNVTVKDQSITVTYIDSSSNVATWGYAITTDAVYLIHVATTNLLEPYTAHYLRNYSKPAPSLTRVLDLWTSKYYITGVECATLANDKFTCIYDTNSTYIYETTVGTHVQDTSVYRYSKLPDYDGNYLQISGSYIGMLASNSRHTDYDIIFYKRQDAGGDINVFAVQNVSGYSPYTLTTNPDGSEKLVIATRDQ